MVMFSRLLFKQYMDYVNDGWIDEGMRRGLMEVLVLGYDREYDEYTVAHYNAVHYIMANMPNMDRYQRLETIQNTALAWRVSQTMLRRATSNIRSR